MTEQEWLASDDLAKMLEWRTHVSWSRTSPPTSVTPRKLWLFACAMMGRFAHLLTDEAVGVIGRAESFADGVGEAPTGWPAVLAGPNGGTVTLDPMTTLRLWEAITLTLHGAEAAALLREIVGNPYPPASRQGLWVVGPETMLTLRPGPWLTTTVLSLAEVAYEDRLPDGTLDPHRLFVLSDAMEEAGCPQDEACCKCKSLGYLAREDDHGTFHVGCTNCGGDGRMTWRDGGGWGPPVVENGRAGTGRQPHPLLAHLRSPGPHVRGCFALDLILGKE